jgi:hypothetical protein
LGLGFEPLQRDYCRGEAVDCSLTVAVSSRVAVERFPADEVAACSAAGWWRTEVGTKRCLQQRGQHIFANRGGYLGEPVGLDPETPLPNVIRCAGLLLKGTLLFLRGLSAAEVLKSQAQAAAAAR